MQSGRLKGQAFIGLPSEQEACQAREDVNGYGLWGKPLVVVICAIDVSSIFMPGFVYDCLAEFSRTTKARETDVSIV